MKMSDYDPMLSLWKASKGIGLHRDDSRKGIENFLKRNPKCSWVAVSGRKIVGTVMGGHNGRRGTLMHLAVAPEYRKRGLGRALVARCLSSLRKAGVRRTYIMVMKSNREGLRFWNRIGWRAREDLALFFDDAKVAPSCRECVAKKGKCR